MMRVDAGPDTLDRMDDLNRELRAVRRQAVKANQNVARMADEMDELNRVVVAFMGVAALGVLVVALKRQRP